MSNIPKINSNFHNHKLPNPSKDWCSCCRKSIIHGHQNVVRIDKAPEKILNLKGQVLGTEGMKEPKAYYHATCFETYHHHTPGRIECKKCGILSMAKTLRDGTKIADYCQCSCHSGKDYCSILIS